MAPGDLVDDRFRLLAQAGKGGTATVFRAFDMQTSASVALKVFNRTNQSEQIQAEICLRETRALEKLDHDRIVRSVASGRCVTSGYRYIAVEWVEGKTLEDHLRTIGQISWQRFFEDLGEDLLDALCHTFECDVSHRDVSLRNVLVATDGRIKVIDFGQAKLTSIGIGVTVGGWKTPPYSPPEEDTGRHTLTRDAYSFAAIAVRACAGKAIANHDELYDAANSIELDATIRPILERALHRDPRSRFENIVTLREALTKGLAPAAEQDPPLKIPLRFLPTAFKWIEDSEDSETIRDAEQQLLDELNEAAAIRLLPDSEGRNQNRIQVETPGHRLIVDLDSAHSDHLVVIGASLKRFSLDGLYKGDALMVDATFRLVAPGQHQRRDESRAAISALYGRVEQALLRGTSMRKGDEFLAEWSRVLDAMREIESQRVPALNYKLVEVTGRRLIVDLENPRDAREDQVRTINRPGSVNWVFKGEIERIEGKRCWLYSKTHAIPADEIPEEGVLSHEWSQTRKALDRQASAIERFRDHATPSESVRALLLRESTGKFEPQFAQVKTFYDTSLNDEKKLLVSQFLANQDLLLIHGPPGTGKTKLIVEIIRQELQRNPLAKILLVSQTHVALDHALVGVAGPTGSTSAVRIVSGVKGIAPAVQHCSVEARGHQLELDVEKASRAFLAAEAKRVGVNYEEVELGIRASEVLRLRDLVAGTEKRCESIQASIGKVSEAAKDPKAEGSTTRRDENRAKLRSLEDELDARNDQLVMQKGQLDLATRTLKEQGTQGEDLSRLDDGELKDWCDLLLDGADKKRLRKLIAIAEDWRLKFATSDDFKAAIIASSRIVAGTCVGFCREAAASRAEYDLCIVDESSKATTTELLLPLSRCKRAILVGDHHQLPPFVEHALKSEALRQQHNLSHDLLEAQLFETLQKDLGDGQKGKLKLQYRMRGGIGRLVSHCFYKKDLDTGLPSDEKSPFPNFTLAGLSRRVTWYDTPIPRPQGVVETRSGTSWVNMHEVNCIVDLLIRIQFLLRSQPKTQKIPSIATISGYAQQVETLNREIGRRTEIARLGVECNSVHTFQGREVDICIYSVTRNNPRGDIGFLDDWRHLNVALSRARWYLVIVGSWPFCSSVRGENPFAEVLKFVGTDVDSELKQATNG